MKYEKFHHEERTVSNAVGKSINFSTVKLGNKLLDILVDHLIKNDLDKIHQNNLDIGFKISKYYEGCVKEAESANELILLIDAFVNSREDLIKAYESLMIFFAMIPKELHEEYLEKAKKKIKLQGKKFAKAKEGKTLNEILKSLNIEKPRKDE